MNASSMRPLLNRKSDLRKGMFFICQRHLGRLKSKTEDEKDGKRRDIRTCSWGSRIVLDKGRLIYYTQYAKKSCQIYSAERQPAKHDGRVFEIPIPITAANQTVCFMVQFEDGPGNGGSFVWKLTYCVKISISVRTNDFLTVSDILNTSTRRTLTNKDFLLTFWKLFVKSFS